MQFQDDTIVISVDGDIIAETETLSNWMATVHDITAAKDVQRLLSYTYDELPWPAKVGLWSESDPVAPWVYREQQ